MKKYLKRFNLEIILIVSIIIIGAFLRLYHVELFGFANDQVRDANIAREILHGKFIGEGPQFSVDTGGTRGHLGPFYFYLIAPVYFLFNNNPLGNVLLLAILNIISIYLIYLVGKKYFNLKTGIISAIILCFSYYVIFHSRFPWNPHMMIFLVLLMLNYFHKAIRKNEKYFLIVGLLLGFVTQTQSAGFLFLLCFALFFIFKLVKLPKIRYLLMSLGILILTYVPLIYFDLTHNLVNYHAYLNMALGKGHTPDYFPSGRLPFARPFMDYFNSLFGVGLSYEKIFFVLFSLVLIGTAIYILVREKNNLSKMIAIFLGTFGIVFALMAYRNKLEEYFFLVITPFIILIIAYFLAKMLKVNIVTRILAIILISLFIFQSQNLYWKDILGKINRNYVQISSAQTLLPDTKEAVNYMVEETRKNSGSLDRTFFVNYLQTCPPHYAINYQAFDYIFNLKGATPSTDSNTKINFYIIQPPESLACANIPKEAGKLISTNQFGKVMVLTYIKE